jgi:hypothetical protein
VITSLGLLFAILNSFTLGLRIPVGRVVGHFFRHWQLAVRVAGGALTGRAVVGIRTPPTGGARAPGILDAWLVAAVGGTPRSRRCSWPSRWR